MTQPKVEIKIYNSIPTLLYTIHDAWGIRSTTRLNDIGTFTFNVPARTSMNTQNYPNADLAKTAKIYYGYGTVSSTPAFVGKIYQTHGSLSDQGYSRVIKGKDLGEVLLRRYHTMDDWVATEADDIAAEIASDLSLGSDLAVDTSAETIRIEIDHHKQYYQLLENVSDYWVNAGTQVKKDFYVDTSNNLVWKARPIRTSGVETFTVEDFISYNVMEDLTQIKNRIHVYGKRGKVFEADQNTEFAADANIETTVDANSASGQKVLNVTATADFTVDDKVWINGGAGQEYNVVASIQAGVSLTMVNNLAYTYVNTDQVVKYPGWAIGYAQTLISESATSRIGSWSIKVEDNGAPSHVGAFSIFDTPLNLNYYPRLNVWLYLNENTTDPHYGWFYITDSGGNDATFELPTIQSTTAEKWVLYSANCGRDYEDNWSGGSAIDWTDIAQCGIVFEENVLDLYIDGFFADNRRYSHQADDTTSQTDYGIHELIVYDDNLSSDSQCESRAEALLYQLKDPITRLDFEIHGNNNVLIGDQLSITIPAEGISATNFDVTSVTHQFLSPQTGWQTFVEAVSTSSSRKIPSRTPNEYLRQVSRKINL